ncbi:MAG: hypothetical protein IPP33_03610 [Flavobacteriales bacterium]|nr:hypothetical protein [Flavobacteriales bacterium]
MVCNGPGSQCAYSSTGTTNIADNTTVTNTIVVPSVGGATITDLNVFVNLTHTYTADLRLSLQSFQRGRIITTTASGLCTDNP